jgi:hypothetical protein
VPNKVRIFAWRLAVDNLPTQRNKWHRTLEVHNICKICGAQTEDSYHAAVECTKAKALRHKMREYWDLPNEEYFRRTGKDWLIILLSNTNRTMHQATLLVLWRAWHLRDDIIHAKGEATIEQSARFLLSYANSFNSNHPSCDHPQDIDTKGKKTVVTSSIPEPQKINSTLDGKKSWEPPPVGWLKANSDGSFITETQSGSTGVVIRDHNGKVIIAAGKILPLCGSAVEAEAMGLLHAAHLANSKTSDKIIFELDCATVVKDMPLGNDSLSQLRSIYGDVSSMLKNFSVWNCVYANRAQNIVAHECASSVRKIGVDCVWISSFPDNVTKAMALDCNRTSVI